MKSNKLEYMDLFSEGIQQNQIQMMNTPSVKAAQELIEKRVVTLGNLLASDRAAEYVALLRVLTEFRRNHEPEPLHEDVMLKMCGEGITENERILFRNDLRQLKEWGLVEERIEKERLRGYRDSRRTKFRYRLCEDAVAFVHWLEERRKNDLNPHSGDMTGNLLDDQRSRLHELLRKIHHEVIGDSVASDIAGGVYYRLEQMNINVDATVRTLQDLNLRLLAFGSDELNIEETKAVVEELGLFLERFAKHFAQKREEIVHDLLELQRDKFLGKWQACEKSIKEEAAKFQHLVSLKIPEKEEVQKILAEATAFYGEDGGLVDLIARVGNSARKVWGKLNAKLREIERRNHRLEDLSVRLNELATLSEETVPHKWLCDLLATATMRGDMHIQRDGEKATPPMPKKSEHQITPKEITWITPRKVGDKPDVVSIAQVRAQRLAEWMRNCAIMPVSDVGALLSQGTYCVFNDFTNILQVIEYVRLGSGEKGKQYLHVTGEAQNKRHTVHIDTLQISSEMTFEDICLRREVGEQ